MGIVEIIRAVVIAYAMLWTSYVVTLPLLSRVGGRSDGDRPAADDREDVTPNIVVIIPAHDMSEVITRCINSVQANNHDRDKVDIYVVADHCNDDTADRSRAAGASVLIRDEGPAGKTYTLGWTLETLTERGVKPDLYVIVDATARVEREFLNSLVQIWRHGEEIVVSHPLLDADNQKWFARCLGLTLVHRNVQNRARQRLSLSAFIEGRGMAYSRRYVETYGWSLALPTSSRSGTHPTEDWRHAVRAVEEGLRVAFADKARVVTPLRATLGAATKQGVRWERGRMANAFTHASRLLVSGIRQRSLVKSLAALDAIQPPVAILGALCAVLALASVLLPGPPLSLALSWLPLGIFFLYGLSVVIEGRKDGIKPVTIFWAPVYLVWRCSAFIMAWSFFDRIKLPARDTK